jgi:hypothetical protein
MFFNYWIGFIYETYIFFGVCASLNAIYYNRFDTTGNAFITLLSILICAVIVLFPVYIKIFFSLKRNYSLIEVEDELFYAKYGHVI